MIKSWIFEFMHAPDAPADRLDPATIAQTYDDAFGIWTGAEDQGFEGIFFSEHHSVSSYSPSPNLLVAAIAQRTKRLRLGTMGIVLPFYEPWRIVEEICMLDHLTGGRLEIGCAAGIPHELARFGLDVAEARERYEEALDFLDAALENPLVTHRGKYWQVENLSILPRPRQQPSPPKWTTVVSTGSAERSAKRRSKICTSFESARRIAEIFDAYRDSADRQGRRAGPGDLAVRRNVSIGRDADEAQEVVRIAKETAKNLMAADTRVIRGEAALLDAPGAGAGFSVHDDEFIAGTPAQVAEQIVEQMRIAGAGHFVGMLGRGLGRKRADQFEMFGRDVIPVLKSADIL
tara:strand:- start:774 stop:1814 length:1041 start_codon:yes stop_codon:yes gene_type:complete